MTMNCITHLVLWRRCTSNISANQLSKD